MKLKEFYNPKHIYDGWFETYFIRPFCHHYADFKGGETWRTCAFSLLAWLIVTLGVTGILTGLVGLLGPEVGFSALYIAGSIWAAASFIPIISLLVRASRGVSPQEKEHMVHPRLLGVDTLLGVSSLLFFIFGVLMMVTTINSGSLDPNAGVTEEVDTTAFEMEEVVEEPIFTYQDEVAPETTATVDTLSDMTEPDLVEPEESFDPTLAIPEEEALETETVSDSII